MADKKFKDKSFQQNPFRGLKGFCVSPPAEKGSAEKEKSPGPPPAPKDEAALFEAEMARLGMVRSEAEAESSVGEGGEEENLSPTSSPSDRELFLDALKGMDTLFSDELPPPEEHKASPRRMKLVRQGRLVPEANFFLYKYPF